jgi:hypothetical protein
MRIDDRILLYCICLIGSLKRNTQLGDFTQKKVETYVSKWLTGSRDRDGKRAECAKAEEEKRRKAGKRRQEHQSDDEQDEAGSSRVEQSKSSACRGHKIRREDESDEQDSEASSERVERAKCNAGKGRKRRREDKRDENRIVIVRLLAEQSNESKHRQKRFKSDNERKKTVMRMIWSLTKFQNCVTV